MTFAPLTLHALPGTPLPFGAHHSNEGVNFSVFSRHAIGMTLLLFATARATEAEHAIVMDPLRNKTGDIWHVALMGLPSGVLYAWQVSGPYAPEQGHRFNPHAIVLDPYAKALVGTDCWNYHACCKHSLPQALSGASSDSRYKAKGLVVADTFDWQDDSPPRHSWSETIIYETHVRGLTIHPSSRVQHPGTFLGVVDKIPYFQELGITTLELLPIQEFYENEVVRINPVSGEPLKNYWGYSTIAFFAPKESYSTRSDYGVAISEFKTMVKALHRAGIEVILDIVFNHTSEGNHLGPTLNFRGLDNQIYYMLEEDNVHYKNYSGTGNTLNCNHPVVRDYILDCLRHWVIDMHVDGFRFDLASILGRDEQGNLLNNPPLLERIAEDPVLRDVKLIAEAWDAGGAYQVGHFHGVRWSEWNGHFRDDVRRFWRGDPGMNGALASRFCGSSDIYQTHNKSPIHSINFVTCHDGFTMAGLVSYERKHNLANGENNTDGGNDNYSSNGGIEGTTDDPIIEQQHLKRIKNMMATLLLARGVPMMLGGDEMRRSQQGNNNAYCQDNPVSWYDWSLLQQNQALFEFVRKLIALRKRFPVLSEQRFYSDSSIQWFGQHYQELPNWQGKEGILGCVINADLANQVRLILLFNASERAISFCLPNSLHAHGWQLLICTSETNDINAKSSEPNTLGVHSNTYVLAENALTVLVDPSKLQDFCAI
jgi:glycogen operon protein